MPTYYPMRRSERVPLAIPIIISGKDSSSCRNFKESSRTINVSKYGGLIATSYKWEQGSQILIENRALSRAATAKVVWVGEGGFAGSPFEAGVEVDGQAHLWPVVEPPLTLKEYTAARTILKQEPPASPAKMSRARDITAIKSGGGEFIGVQPGLPGSIPDQYLFNDPKTGTTLAIGTGEVTPESVRAKIAAARAMSYRRRL